MAELDERTACRDFSSLSLDPSNGKLYYVAPQTYGYDAPSLAVPALSASPATAAAAENLAATLAK